MTSVLLGITVVRLANDSDPTRPGHPGLLDKFGRVATELRVSLTDRCNLCCTYCMPTEGLTAPGLPPTGSYAPTYSLKVKRICGGQCAPEPMTVSWPAYGARQCGARRPGLVLTIRTSLHPPAR